MNNKQSPWFPSPTNEVQKVTSERVTKIVNFIQEENTKWKYACLNVLYPGLPFDKSNLAKLVNKNKYKIHIFPSNNEYVEREYLAYRDDFVEEQYLKYIAEFTIKYEEGLYTSRYTVPKYNGTQILKTKLIFSTSGLWSKYN